MEEKELIIELNESQLNNLILFLDRIEYKGLKEVEAINSITSALRNSKIKDEVQSEI